MKNKNPRNVMLCKGFQVFKSGPTWARTKDPQIMSLLL
jgi:hypothetical protein